MFEKYTEKARRVMFFARYEASQMGSKRIEAEHVLLGLIREDKDLAKNKTLNALIEELSFNVTISFMSSNLLS